jgi:hypothetical protein
MTAASNEVLDDLRSWVNSDENKKRRRHLEAIERRINSIQRFQRPEAMDAGSLQQQIAQARITRLLQEASALGYETPGVALKKEAVTHGLGLALGVPL